MDQRLDLPLPSDCNKRKGIKFNHQVMINTHADLLQELIHRSMSTRTHTQEYVFLIEVSQSDAVESCRGICHLQQVWLIKLSTSLFM